MTTNCPNQWHRSGYGATGARCPQCPPLSEMTDVNAADVLQAALFGGLDVPVSVTLVTPVEFQDDPMVMGSARVKVRVGGMVFRVRVDEVKS